MIFKVFLLLALVLLLVTNAQPESSAYTKEAYCIRQTLSDAITADSIKHCSPAPAPQCVNGPTTSNDVIARDRYVTRRNRIKDNLPAIRKYYTGSSGKEDMRAMLMLELDEVIDMWYSTQLMAVETIAQMFSVQELPRAPDMFLALMNNVLGVLFSIGGFFGTPISGTAGLASNLCGLAFTVANNLKSGTSGYQHNTAITAEIMNNYRSELLFAKIEMKTNKTETVDRYMSDYERLTDDTSRNKFLKSIYDAITYIHQTALPYKDVVNRIVSEYLKSAGGVVVVDYETAASGRMKQWRIQNLPQGLSGSDIARLWARVNGGCMQLPSNIPLVVRQLDISSQMEYLTPVPSSDGSTAFKATYCYTGYGGYAESASTEAFGICSAVFYRNIVSAGSQSSFNFYCLKAQNHRTDQITVLLSTETVPTQDLTANLVNLPKALIHGTVIPLSRSSESCTSSYFVPTYVKPTPERLFATIGGQFGVTNFVQHYARRITELTCYRSGSYLQRIVFGFSSGPTAAIGKNAGSDPQYFKLNAGEWFDSIWHASGSYVDRIKFITTAGRVHYCGGTESDSYPYWIRFPYTYLLRIESQFGSVIDSIKFYVPDTRTLNDPFFALSNTALTFWIPRPITSQYNLYTTTSDFAKRKLVGIFCRWADTNRIRQLTFLYNDGSNDVIGDNVGQNYAGILLERDEYFTHVQYVQPTGLEKFKFRTSKGRTVPCGAKTESEPYNWDFAPGLQPSEVIYGMTVNYGENIDNIGFHIASKVE